MRDFSKSIGKDVYVKNYKNIHKGILIDVDYNEVEIFDLEYKEKIKRYKSSFNNNNVSDTWAFEKRKIKETNKKFRKPSDDFCIVLKSTEIFKMKDIEDLYKAFVIEKNRRYDIALENLFRFIKENNITSEIEFVFQFIYLDDKTKPFKLRIYFKQYFGGDTPHLVSIKKFDKFVENYNKVMGNLFEKGE